MRNLTRLLALTATATGLALGAVTLPAQAETAPYCGIMWGSLPKSGGQLSQAPLTNVRAGQHECYDRIVMDIAGAQNGFDVSYQTTVYNEGGQAIPLRGGAFLAIHLKDPAYDSSGSSTYNPANPKELVNVTGYRTLRQASWGGSFEGYTTIGLGVRARLPFQVFYLAGPGGGSRVVIDVAHKW